MGWVLRLALRGYRCFPISLLTQTCRLWSRCQLVTRTDQLRPHIPADPRSTSYSPLLIARCGLTNWLERASIEVFIRLTHSQHVVTPNCRFHFVADVQKWLVRTEPRAVLTCGRSLPTSRPEYFHRRSDG